MEFSKFTDILSVAFSQHHLLGFEIAQLKFQEDRGFRREPLGIKGSLVPQMVKNLPAVWETQVRSIPGSGRSPGGREWQPTSVFLPGEFHGQRNLVGYYSP